MKKIMLTAMILFSVIELSGQKFIRSNIQDIRVQINGMHTAWAISPETNPDRLRVYCNMNINSVVFQTDIDTAQFEVKNHDTIRFAILLKSKDTAYTEIIGIRDLPSSITAEEKVFGLSRIWSETKYNFVNIDQFKYDIDSVYRTYIPLVQATVNDYEYYQVLRKFLAGMHDGHTEVYDNGQFSRYRDYIPISLADFDKRIYITAVRKTPVQDSTWVGAEVIEIEGMPTLQYLELNIFPYISASTEQHLWMQAIYKLQGGFKEQSFNCTIKKQDGKVEKIQIPRNGEATRTAHDQSWGTIPSWPSKIVELQWLERGIALVSFNRFAPEKEAIDDFTRIAAEINQASGLIIDLRHNGGGSTEVAHHLQKYLTKGRYFLNYGWETRVSDGVRKANGNWIEAYSDYYLDRAYRFEKPDTVFVPDSLKRILCPVIILTGRYTFSAAEDFLVNLYELPGRPLIMGAETGGSTGSPLVVSGLPGDGYARICTRRICYPQSGRRFVNSGVKPDIEVKSGIEDYLLNRDLLLEKAIEECRRMTSR